MKPLLLLLLLAYPITSLSDNAIPELGASSQTVLSPTQELQIGRSSMLQIRASQQYLNDAEVHDYLNQLGNRLVENSDEPWVDFEFFAINNEGINAFALPGGFIGVNSGLILLAESESELAAVLSHEVAHVTQHHIARIIEAQKGSGLKSIAALAIAILAARNNSQASQVAVAGAQAHTIQKQIDFTREHEREADRLGLEILRKARFNPHAMPLFLERMQRATRLQEGDLPSYLRTHPITNERVSDIGNRVSTLPHPLLANSLSFELVQAKLRAHHLASDQAIIYFTTALDKQFGEPIAHRYGLAQALLRDRQANKAAEQLKQIRLLMKKGKKGQHPMIETLAGQISLATRPIKETLEFYRQSQANFPQHRTLAYDYANLLIQQQQAQAALNILNELSGNYRNDIQLYELQARAYALQQNRFEQYRAQASALAWQGKLREAQVQLNFAKQVSQGFYQQSTIESDLKEVRELLKAHEQN